MIDLLYLTHNRLEFTKASLAALQKNTDWSLVSRFIVYDDWSTDGTYEYLLSTVGGEKINRARYGGPVAVMNDYLAGRDPKEPKIFGKIDSDTMVPAGWLGQCLDAMDRHPELDLLGIEAFCPVVTEKWRRGYEPSSHIGGIGLMRSTAFVTLPRPDGRFGFTAWQDHNPKVKRGWINPSLPVFLLDRLPREPWLTYSKQYVESKWQRHWPPYTESYKKLWSWWCE